MPPPSAIAAAARRAGALASLTGGSAGELVPLAVHYYLQDGTFEVVELLPKKGGKDPFPRLLGRSRLPRALPAPGAWRAGHRKLQTGGGGAVWVGALGCSAGEAVF